MALKPGTGIECPKCHGKKGWQRETTPPWVSEPQYEWIHCWVCWGQGEIDQLQAAIIQARGGLPPWRPWPSWAKPPERDNADE